MSRINDALKKVSQASPPSRNAPGLPTYRPPIAESSAGAGWMLPAIMVAMVVAAILCIGWAMMHRNATPAAVAPKPAKVVAAVSPATTIKPKPEVRPQPVNPAPVSQAPASPASTPVSTKPLAKPSQPAPPPLPKLQGIFYSSAAPSAIIGGRTIHPGDHYQQYRVKTISKNTVTLVGPDQKEIRLGMEN
jgi:hypothetical protein